MMPHPTRTARLLAVLLLAFAVFTLQGCATRVSARVSPTYAQHQPDRVAVMPIRNQTGNALAAPASHAYLKALLEKALSSRPLVTNDVPLSFRRQINHTLYQKAYRVLPLEVVDTRIGHRQLQDMLRLPAAEAQQLLGADSLLTSTITAWDTRKLKTDNTVMLAASFSLVDLDTKTVLWEAEWPYARVSINAAQPWHDVQYYISRVVDEVFATLPRR
jgi:hypothetical protein